MRKSSDATGMRIHNIIYFVQLRHKNNKAPKKGLAHTSMCRDLLLNHYACEKSYKEFVVGKKT